MLTVNGSVHKECASRLLGQKSIFLEVGSKASGLSSLYFDGSPVPVRAEV